MEIIFVHGIVALGLDIKQFDDIKAFAGRVADNEPVDVIEQASAKRRKLRIRCT